MKRKINLFDRIGSLIRSYKGYVIRDEKRNTDKKLRDELATKIEYCEVAIVDFQQVLIKNNLLQQCQEWDIARKSLNTLRSKIKHAVYGESSFFSENQLKENELDEIYDYDFEIIERVDVINKTIEFKIKESDSPVVINEQVREIYSIITKRTNFINSYK